MENLWRNSAKPENNCASWNQILLQKPREIGFVLVELTLEGVWCRHKHKTTQLKRCVPLSKASKM
jgi:hypothetical protein